MNHGRPLRFLGLTMGGWTLIRVALLWPTIDSVPALVRAIAPPVAAATRPAATGRASPVPPPAPIAAIVAAPATPVPPPPSDPPRIAPATPATLDPDDARPTEPMPRPVQPPPLRPAPLATPPRRLAGSLWGIARGGANDALTGGQPGGQLGGSQAGARLTYALGAERRIALAARVSAPLHGRGAEIGLGLDWQPTALPLHLIAEQRIPLDGGRGGPTVMVVGGLDPRPVALGFRLEAYGQAGAIARGPIERFADGAARLTRPVARAGALRLDLGVGAWGGAQRGAARLDLGPSLAVALPVDRRSIRITLDWRQRIAGRARPGSGPALSIGGDF